jgi:hypothetical protein
VIRPYRIPIPDWAALPLIIPPTVGVLILFAIATWTTYIFVFGVIVIGIMLQFLKKVTSHNASRFVSNNLRHHHTAVDNQQVVVPVEDSFVATKRTVQLGHQTIKKGKKMMESC